MEKNHVSCNDLPDVLSKGQFYKMCHINKKTASALFKIKKSASKKFKSL